MMAGEGRADELDQLYLHLKGARERLCLAQMLCVNAGDSRSLGEAVVHIDSVGSLLPQWSKFDRDDLLPKRS